MVKRSQGSWSFLCCWLWLWRCIHISIRSRFSIRKKKKLVDGKRDISNIDMPKRLWKLYKIFFAGLWNLLSSSIDPPPSPRPFSLFPAHLFYHPHRWSRAEFLKSRFLTIILVDADGSRINAVKLDLRCLGEKRWMSELGSGLWS